MYSLLVAFWITPLVIESKYGPGELEFSSYSYFDALAVFFFLVMWQAFGWWRYRTPTPPTLKLLVSLPVNPGSYSMLSFSRQPGSGLGNILRVVCLSLSSFYLERT